MIIKSFCGNLDICLNYYANVYFRSQSSVRGLSVADRVRTRKMPFQITLFGHAPQQPL